MADHEPRLFQIDSSELHHSPSTRISRFISKFLTRAKLIACPPAKRGRVLFPSAPDTAMYPPELVLTQTRKEAGEVLGVYVIC